MRDYFMIGMMVERNHICLRDTYKKLILRLYTYIIIVLLVL